jgi:hypothetical protein
VVRFYESKGAANLKGLGRVDLEIRLVREESDMISFLIMRSAVSILSSTFKVTYHDDIVEATSHINTL